MVVIIGVSLPMCKDDKQEMYCLGSGIDIMNKANNKRSLHGFSARKVTVVFIDTGMFAEETRPDIDCDSLIHWWW